jgi:RNase P subunit RPR2
MKIIKKGKIPKDIPYNVSCDDCSTIFEFHAKEAKYTTDTRDGDYLTIKCPVCKKKIDVAAQ